MVKNDEKAGGRAMQPRARARRSSGVSRGGGVRFTLFSARLQPDSSQTLSRSTGHPDRWYLMRKHFSQYSGTADYRVNPIWRSLMRR